MNLQLINSYAHYFNEIMLRVKGKQWRLDPSAFQLGVKLGVKPPDPNPHYTTMH